MRPEEGEALRLPFAGKVGLVAGASRGIRRSRRTPVRGGGRGAPGPILTPHLERAGEEAQREAAQSTPMRRIGRAEEVAGASP